MIKVSAQKLDVHALGNGDEIRILTAANSIRILTGDRAGEVSMGFRPTGKGEQFIEEGGWRTRWLNLAALEPQRMYRLRLVRSSGGSVAVDFEDITPGSQTPSGSPRRNLLDRLLGRGR